MIAKQTYFLNADRTKTVPEGDKAAQFLLVREGQEISDALAEQYGLGGKKDSAHEEKGDAHPKDKPHGKK